MDADHNKICFIYKSRSWIVYNLSLKSPMNLPWQLLRCFVQLLYVLCLFAFLVLKLFSTPSLRRMYSYHVHLFSEPAKELIYLYFNSMIFHLVHSNLAKSRDKFLYDKSDFLFKWKENVCFPQFIFSLYMISSSVIDIWMV